MWFHYELPIQSFQFGCRYPGQRFDTIDSSIVAQSLRVAVVTENYTPSEDLLFDLHFPAVYFGTTATRKY